MRDKEMIAAKDRLIVGLDISKVEDAEAMVRRSATP